MNPILNNALLGTRFKVLPWRSEEYLAMVRQFPCCRCGAGPAEPHHWGPRGKAQKTDDFRTIPLCRACHDAFHRGEWGSPIEDQLFLYEQVLRMVHAWLLQCDDSTKGE